MQKITPFLWFNDQAEAAARFYTSIFKNASVVATTRHAEGGPGPAGQVMTVSFVLDGQEFIALNGGPQYTFTEATSFQIDCDGQDEVDYYWDKLTADGGQEGQCGWLKDKFGLSWQVVPRQLPLALSNADPAKAKAAMQAMMQMKKIDIAALERAGGAGAAGSTAVAGAASGTDAHVTPAPTEEPAPVEPIAVPAAGPAPLSSDDKFGASQKIVIVEDNESLADIYQTRLSLLGYECHVAYDGQAALQTIERELPDLVLLDLMVPKMAGDQILATMRKSDWGKDIKVYVISNLNEADAPAGLRELGIEGYAVKANLSNDQLDRLVDNILKPADQQEAVVLETRQP